MFYLLGTEFLTIVLNLHLINFLFISGTLDPTPYIYDTTMYALGGLMSVAVLSAYLVRPLKVTQATVVEIKNSASGNDASPLDVSFVKSKNS